MSSYLSYLPSADFVLNAFSSADETLLNNSGNQWISHQKDTALEKLKTWVNPSTLIEKYAPDAMFTVASRAGKVWGNVSQLIQGKIDETMIAQATIQLADETFNSDSKQSVSLALKMNLNDLQQSITTKAEDKTESNTTTKTDKVAEFVSDAKPFVSKWGTRLVTSYGASWLLGGGIIGGLAWYALMGKSLYNDYQDGFLPRRGGKNSVLTEREIQIITKHVQGRAERAGVKGDQWDKESLAHFVQQLQNLDETTLKAAFERAKNPGLTPPAKPKSSSTAKPAPEAKSASEIQAREASLRKANEKLAVLANQKPNSTEFNAQRVVVKKQELELYEAQGRDTFNAKQLVIDAKIDLARSKEEHEKAVELQQKKHRQTAAHLLNSKADPKKVLDELYKATVVKTKHLASKEAPDYSTQLEYEQEELEAEITGRDECLNFAIKHEFSKEHQKNQKAALAHAKRTLEDFKSTKDNKLEIHSLQEREYKTEQKRVKAKLKEERLMLQQAIQLQANECKRAKDKTKAETNLQEAKRQLAEFDAHYDAVLVERTYNLKANPSFKEQQELLDIQRCCRLNRFDVLLDRYDDLKPVESREELTKKRIGAQYKLDKFRALAPLTKAQHEKADQTKIEALKREANCGIAQAKLTRAIALKDDTLIKKAEEAKAEAEYTKEVAEINRIIQQLVTQKPNEDALEDERITYWNNLQTLRLKRSTLEFEHHKSLKEEDKCLSALQGIKSAKEGMAAATHINNKEERKKEMLVAQVDYYSQLSQLHLEFEDNQASLQAKIDRIPLKAELKALEGDDPHAYEIKAWSEIQVSANNARLILIQKEAKLVLAVLELDEQTPPQEACGANKKAFELYSTRKDSLKANPYLLNASKAAKGDIELLKDLLPYLKNQINYLEQDKTGLGENHPALADFEAAIKATRHELNEAKSALKPNETAAPSSSNKLHRTSSTAADEAEDFIRGSSQPKAKTVKAATARATDPADRAASPTASWFN